MREDLCECGRPLEWDDEALYGGWWCPECDSTDEDDCYDTLTDPPGDAFEWWDE